MPDVRVVHYVNQFFAGLGGEDMADSAPQFRDGCVGPARGLDAALAGAGTVVATVFCGDNYVTRRPESASAEIVELIRPYEPDVVVAGPSFGSGRYGLACGAVCREAQEKLGVAALAAMYEESPGAEQYRKFVTIVPTHETVAGMKAALGALARLAPKLGRGEALGSPSADGYLARGFRRNEFASERAAHRAVDAVLRKHRGEPVQTEWPLPRYDRVGAPPPLPSSEHFTVALVTEGALVPSGNPDRLPSSWGATWEKYDISDFTDLTADGFETVHGGFDTTAVNADPDRLVPLDALRELEGEYNVRTDLYLYSTCGNMSAISDMRRVGAEIADDLRERGIGAAIIGAT